MSLGEKERICPVCGRPMRLLTAFSRGPDEQTYVLECRPCGLSTTKTLQDDPRHDGGSGL